MTYQVRRECGCVEKIEFKGSDAAWRERDAMLKRLPCSKCHAKRLQERVSAGVPTLLGMCFGK